MAIVAALAVSATACGRRTQTGASTVRAAMAATARESRSLIYRVDEAGTSTIVRAQVHDDLRYKAAVTVNGTPWLEEVAVDDALADHLLDVNHVVESLRRPGKVTTPAFRDAASSNRWMVDPLGAPSLLPVAGAPKRVLGVDPVIDALTAFRHVDQALTDAGGAHRFNPDSLDYRPQEDPFPRPKAGVVRYDFERPRLPRAEDAVGGGARAIPGPANFRRMSLYVRAGRVVEVREVMDIATRLKDVRRLYDLGLPATARVDEAVAAVVNRLNQLRRPTGGEPIRLRSLTLSFVDIGKPVSIALPADAATVDLSYFRDRGAPVATPASSSTTTSVVAAGA
jgi:hypothetical protein